ncbi:hypothetical protein H5410_054544 [Solanum commersonii]|uniref:Uncharacterized protein n=1 Tax=Solanum commersonii TaxID=4109 RepID=A0A9J5WFL0_SOLCO|nr:hypothetical protein H5410_054544 [Solanum commersonii]
MATSEGLADTKEWHVIKNWRNAQKEKERERCRIRDRLRRQTMSNEEREKYLARRRRNYQLRRQKVLKSSSFSTCQNYDSTTSAGYSNEEENQAIVPVSGLGIQLSDATFHPELYKSQEEPADASSTLHQGRSRRGIRLIDVKRLARALNSN